MLYREDGGEQRQSAQTPLVSCTGKQQGGAGRAHGSWGDTESCDVCVKVSLDERGSIKLYMVSRFTLAPLLAM